MPKTYTLCGRCGRKIPWGEKRVAVQLKEGSQILDSWEECDNHANSFSLEVREDRCLEAK